jgi:UDP-glucuronate 4-epimerase
MRCQFSRAPQAAAIECADHSEGFSDAHPRHRPAGFIGAALAGRRLARGNDVYGIDNHNDYYDPKLKEARLARFAQHPNDTRRRADLADADVINDAFAAFRPQRVVNLAAQASVRYSLKSPQAYVRATRWR